MQHFDLLMITSSRGAKEGKMSKYYIIRTTIIFVIIILAFGKEKKIRHYCYRLLKYCCVNKILCVESLLNAALWLINDNLF